MSKYTFHKDGQEHGADNLSAFCREHGLQRRHMQEVAVGMRKGHRGWTRTSPTVPIPINGGDDDDDPNGPGSMTVDQLMRLAEIAAKTVGGEYEKQAMEKIAMIRRHEPIPVYVKE